MILSTEQRDILMKLKDLPLPTLSSVIKNLRSFDVDTEEHQEFYSILLKLTIESRQLKLSDRDVDHMLRRELSFDDEHARAISEYIRDQNDIFVSDNLRFVDLEWRLEAKIASRSIHSISEIEPKILIKMNVDGESALRFRPKIPSTQQVVMTTNASNLIHIIQKLEQALVDSKTIARK